MKHSEVKQLQRQLIELINHNIKKKVDVFHVNYGLDKNMSRLNSAVEELDKHINKELVEIEKEAFEIAQKESIDIGEAIKKLPEEKQTKHTELMLEYNKSMQEENEFQIYYLDPSKCDSLKIDFEYLQILKKFFKED